jgi:hypothetical protein
MSRNTKRNRYLHWLADQQNKRQISTKQLDEWKEKERETTYHLGPKWAGIEVKRKWIRTR